MTAKDYFELCETLGNEPLEEEIPVEVSDFPEEIQTAFSLYYKIPDRWEYMSGSYLGKDLSCFKSIADILAIDNQRFYLDIILIIDSIRVELLSARQKQKSKEAKNGNI